MKKRIASMTTDELTKFFDRCVKVGQMSVAIRADGGASSEATYGIVAVQQWALEAFDELNRRDSFIKPKKEKESTDD